jgi:catechol 2,3-dioxygenase-like lactoylglutathione lyase family enzyme
MRSVVAGEGNSQHKIHANALDHVALWMPDRDVLAEFLYGHLEVHEIERTDQFTLVGANARKGKLTLFAAEGEREAGVLGPIVLRVSDLDAALERLPEDLPVERPNAGLVLFDAPGGLPLGLVASSNGGSDYDIDHVVLRVPEPSRTRAGLAELGFEEQEGDLNVGDKRVVLERAELETSKEPLLNHIALLVDSGRDQLAEAERRGLQVVDVRDAENTFAVFVAGPDGITLEYVEHKPGFSLV